MTTLREDLERMGMTLRSVTDHEVVVYCDERAKRVDVNFDFNAALVLECELHMTKMWTMHVIGWDRTGGISDEMELGMVREEYVPGIVKIFLDTQDANAAALDAILEGSDPS